MTEKEETRDQKEQPVTDPPDIETGGTGIPAFNTEDIRQKFEAVNTERELKEKRQYRRRLLVGIPAAIVVCALMTFVSIRAVTAFRENQLAIAATLTAESLSAMSQNADNLMLSDNPQEALLIYEEIKQIDSSFHDIDQKISLAEAYLKAIDLYQQGIKFLNNGESAKALEIFTLVEQLHPDYLDTRKLIKRIQQEGEIVLLIKGIEESYSKENWQMVIDNYEAVLAIDPFIELPDLKDELFHSYRNVIIALAGRKDLTLEEIEIADDYYRKAIALVPQDKAYAEEREELKKIATELLANKYFLHALEVLEGTNYSYEGLQEAIPFLEKANNIGVDSATISAEIENARLFLDSYDNMVNLNWNKAINGLEELLRKDENYANGRAKYFLYEAYTAQGDLLLTYADFDGAFLGYQEAEKWAWNDKQNLLRLFQIQVRVAVVLAKLDDIDESAEYYNYAFEHLDYSNKLTDPGQQDLLTILLKAEQTYQKGNVHEAIRLYETAMDQQEKLFDLKTISVKQGETLLNIAFEQGTTIEYLRMANDIGEAMVIGSDQDLLAPVNSAAIQ